MSKRSSGEDRDPKSVQANTLPDAREENTGQIMEMVAEQVQICSGCTGGI